MFIRRSSWTMAVVLVASAFIPTILFSEEPHRNRIALPLPPLPSDARHLKYDPTKSSQDNANARSVIVKKLDSLMKELGENDEVQMRSSESVRAFAETEIDHSSSRSRITDDIASWQQVLMTFDIESICGKRDRSQEVERYDGSLGPTKEFVKEHHPSTGQIQWNDNLATLFNRAGDDAGDVNGERWCSGTLITDKLFLTAGHCFDIDSNGWRTPKRAKESVAPEQLASLMHVNFNYQIDATTGEIRQAVTYPIVRLLEYRLGKFDYAVAELGVGTNGEMPGARFTPRKVDASDQALLQATLLTVIQHPAGNPKRIAAGSKIRNDGTSIYYGDVDTLGGSSGSGVIDQTGNLIGVHTNGGCTARGGANSGVSLVAIRGVSEIVKK